jgi:cysteine desulfurase
MRHIYLDHASTTPTDSRVIKAMHPFQVEMTANASSFHSKGKEVRDAIDLARIKVANAINARPDEIIFTSGGTEADNMAILGIARQHAKHGKHIITTKIEHQAVLEPLHHLENKEGFTITYIQTDKFGEVNAEQIISAITPETTLISIIFGNNEIGTINNIQEIGKAIFHYRQKNKTNFPLFHTDACQVIGNVKINVEALHVDLLTLNGGKIYGPKGIGALYIKRGIKMQPLFFGGSQEFARRPGTENAPAIIGLGEAITIADAEIENYIAQVTPLRDKLINGLLALPKTRLNGHPEHRLANNVNISFMDIEGEALLLYLDAVGIYASTGSACTSASLDPSHVITGLGLPYEVAHGSIRFTLGRQTTAEDIDYVLEKLPPLVEKLRAISPVNVDPKYYE